MATAVSDQDFLQPSITNALPHYLPLTVFPLIIAAAIYGGWWLAAPFVFFGLVGPLDLAFGFDDRNMDPKAATEKQLLWYNIPVWGWAFLWLATFVFSIFQIFVVGNLAWWEGVVLAIILTIEGQAIFIIGHELIHRRSPWERYFGEFVLASGSYPHYATEHFYIHHAYVGTPVDVGSAPKGYSFWRYFPRELKHNLTGAWKMVGKRMERRRLPFWHYSNPFWRYGSETLAFYVFIVALGGWWAAPVYLLLCMCMVCSMKITNYMQHYGLRRIRLPHGRFERAQPRHSWSANYKFSKWMFYNYQRHADHHVVASRNYPLLQHYGADESPQLPASQGTMFNLVLRPQRWFEKMDPVVDQWREKFYPEITDWSAYDSTASIERPEAFDVIVELYGTAPRLANAIERTPELLDSLQDREFTDLDIPGGFGSDSEAETIARRGLTRVYWLYELSVSEMEDRLSQIPAQDAPDTAEIVRNWSNDKVFQVAVHTMRGNLSPVEASIVLANIAQVVIATVLKAVVDDSAERNFQSNGDAIAIIAFDDLAAKRLYPRSNLELLLVYEKNPSASGCELIARFRDAIKIVAKDSLLFNPISQNAQDISEITLTEFANYGVGSEGIDQKLKLAQSRCIASGGNETIASRFEEVRRSVLSKEVNHDELVSHLLNSVEPIASDDYTIAETMHIGLQKISAMERFLSLTSDFESPESKVSSGVDGLYQAVKTISAVSDECAEKLKSAEQMLRNLCGFLRLILDDDKSLETASDEVKSAVCLVSEVEQFSDLKNAVSSALADIEEAWAKVAKDG